MKKSAILCLVLFVFIAGLFAAENTYTKESSQYKTFRAIFVLSKREAPALTLPVSSSQLLLALKDIQRSELTSEVARIYDDLVAELKTPETLYDFKDGAKLSGTFDLIAEGNFHSGKSQFSDQFRQYRDLEPLMVIGGGIHFGNLAYAEIDLSIKDKVSSYIEKTEKNKFVTNFYNFSSSELSQIPNKAYMSLGNGNLSFIVGRDRVSAGNGFTGDLSLGDNFCFQDFAKLSVLYRPFVYDMTVMSFNLSSNGNRLNYVPSDMNSANNVVVVHRLTSYIKNTSFTLYEGILQYGDNIFSNLQIVNPFMMLHNTMGYTVHTQNNFFGIEFGFTPLRGINVSGQFIADQIQLSSEKNDDGSIPDDMTPNAFGGLLNVNGAFVLNKKPATWYVEGAYTSPALYLKEDYLEKGKVVYSHYDTDLIVGNAMYNNTLSDVSYLGYKYGPDSIVGAAGFTSEILDDLNIKADARVIVHGEKGIELYDSQKTTITTGKEAYKQTSPTGTPEIRLQGVLQADYSVLDYVSLNCQLGILDAINYQNIEDKNLFDVQLSLGFRIKLAKLASSFI